MILNEVSQAQVPPPDILRGSTPPSLSLRHKHKASVGKPLLVTVIVTLGDGRAVEWCRDSRGEGTRPSSGQEAHSRRLLEWSLASLCVVTFVAGI